MRTKMFVAAGIVLLAVAILSKATDIGAVLTADSECVANAANENGLAEDTGQADQTLGQNPANSNRLSGLEPQSLRNDDQCLQIAAWRGTRTTQGGLKGLLDNPGQSPASPVTSSADDLASQIAVSTNVGWESVSPSALDRLTGSGKLPATDATSP